MAWNGWPNGWPPTPAGRHGRGVLHGAWLARHGGQPPTYFLIPTTWENPSGAFPARRRPRQAAIRPRSGPKRLLVLLDCCHAGQDVKALAPVSASAATGFAGARHPAGLLMEPLAGAEKALSGRRGEQEAGAVGASAGRAVLSSSQGEQLSYIRRDRKMSIFTYHLIGALTGHARRPREPQRCCLRCDGPCLAPGAGQRPRRSRRRAAAGLPGQRQLRRGAAPGRQGAGQGRGRARSAGGAGGAGAGERDSDRHGRGAYIGGTSTPTAGSSSDATR